MFEIKIFFPKLMENAITFRFKSLRAASIGLDVSYYFLYNCYHEKHKNQFTSFFRINKMSVNGEYLPYGRPKTYQQQQQQQQQKQQHHNDDKHKKRKKISKLHQDRNNMTNIKHIKVLAKTIRRRSKHGSSSCYSTHNNPKLSHSQEKRSCLWKP